jgi:predicted amino acid dehydrogenase
MAKAINFEEIHAKAAGIDIGSKGIFVSTVGERRLVSGAEPSRTIDGEQVVTFKTFTADYHLCGKYLKENGIQSAAMDGSTTLTNRSTGVYWMSLYSMLEERGIKVCLVHPREVQQVKGRKTDVKDSRWIQKLYSAGLLRESIVAEGKFKELRMLTRERLDLMVRLRSPTIEMGSSYINKMQKYCELMNIKLHNAMH